MKRKKHVYVIPSIDLGGTKIAMAFISADEQRDIIRSYSPIPVVKVNDATDAVKTLKRIAASLKKRCREMEDRGYRVLKCLGMGAPGLYMEDHRVDPASVPNIPGLADIKPAQFLEKLLGQKWKVFIQNDGTVQALAAANAFLKMLDSKKTGSKALNLTDGKIIYFGPGTGFGAGKVLAEGNKLLTPMGGSQAFFDMVIRNGKTAEDLIGGRAIGRIAQNMEEANLKKGHPVFLKFAEGFKTWKKNSDKQTEKQLLKISGKTVADAYASRNTTAKKMAKDIFVQVGKDLAELIIHLHRGKGKKALFKWAPEDWQSVKNTRVFLVAGFLTKPTGKAVILPEARKVLRKAGYGKKISIIETDQLPAIKKIKDKIGLYGASLMVPDEQIRNSKWSFSLTIGKNSINRAISKTIQKTFLEKQKPVLVAIDGYSGIEWKKSIARLQKQMEKDGVKTTAVDMSNLFLPESAIQKKIQPDLGKDKTFGRITRSRLEDFLNQNRLVRLKKQLENARKTPSRHLKAILCFGSGAACKPLISFYDVIIYRDLTREEINQRVSKGKVVPLGTPGKAVTGKGQPAYLAGKRFHYIDFPLLDRHKKAIRNRIDFYMDDTVAQTPKMIDGMIFDEMVSHMSRGPFQLKVFHDKGVWGGQWLKKMRDLPKEMINYAWAYELMAYHMSVNLPVGGTVIETPFANLLDRQTEAIMGSRVRKRFKDMWPIRVNYDDCWKGGDMAIQIHPDAAYVKQHFREPLHQDESYYIVAASPNAYVYLGLKTGVDLEEFRRVVLRAEHENIPFDHRQYVNVFPAKEGDLFLIPAGTVHASGKGCVVLELSATTDRYTFHFYDYLRPDLNGKLRDIHSEHAFRMAQQYPHRITSWVKRHLIQKPRLIRKGKDWTEHLIGKLENYVPEIHRFVLATNLKDDTNGIPHVLSMVKGNQATVQSDRFPERRMDLKFTETIVLPAALGPYTIINQGKRPVTILKTVVNASLLD